eukprot:4281608-Pyramimonas_sp.AAC.2
MAAIARASVPLQRVPTSPSANASPAHSCPALSARANLVGQTQKVVLKGKACAGKASRHVTQMVAAPKPVPDMKGVARPDDNGRFGKFGGRYVPETLIYALDELTVAFKEAIKDPAFQEELAGHLKDFVGRESPLYFAERMSADLGND